MSKSKIVNNGFRDGLTHKDIHLLCIVEVEFNDSPNSLMVVTWCEKHAHNYKGYYSYKGIFLEDSSDEHREHSFESDQIVRVVAKLKKLGMNQVCLDHSC